MGGRFEGVVGRKAPSSDLLPAPKGVGGPSTKGKPARNVTQANEHWSREVTDEKARKDQVNQTRAEVCSCLGTSEDVLLSPSHHP